MEQTLEEQWAEFKRKFKKQYDSEEQERNSRKSFESNLKIINEHNIMFNNGQISYSVRITQFTDLDLEKRSSDSTTDQPSLGCSLKKLPTSKDWRTENVVTAVKDGGAYRTCWAFSAIESLEGQIAIKTKKLNPLSAQNLVDCCSGYEPTKGGSLIEAFEYIKKNGITTEAMYPYEGRKGIYRKVPEDSLVKISGYVQIPPDEKSLLSAVATVGPVSIGLLCDYFSLCIYSSGIYVATDFPSNYYHAALIVGYGSEDSTDYWLVKNSWGEEWGENGYFRIPRNEKNSIKIAYYTILK